MAEISSPIGLKPEESVQYFRGKGYAVQANWDQLWQEEHGRAFTVTKMMNGALLDQVRASLDDVIANGGTYEQWKTKIVPQLQAAGWYGKVELAEITGTPDPVFIGDRRLRTIFDTNLRMANAAGKWSRIQTLKKMAPFLMYDAVHDRRTRPLHRLWGGLDDGRPIILPADHPAWSVYFPPCGWNCRCGVIQLSQRDLDRRGLKVTTDAELVGKGWLSATGVIGGVMQAFRRSNGTVEQVPKGIDPGFAYNPGEHFLSSMVPPAADGPLDSPAIITGELPPMPPARSRPASALLDPATPPQDAIDRFLASFEGPTDGITVLATDKLGEPQVIDDSFFWRGGSAANAASKLESDPGRIEVMDLLSEALRDPDEIWWVWEPYKQADGTMSQRLVRRYVTVFEIDGEQRYFMAAMQFGQGGWKGLTTFLTSKQSYVDSRVRGGVLAYRRK